MLTKEKHSFHPHSIPNTKQLEEVVVIHDKCSIGCLGFSSYGFLGSFEFIGFLGISFLLLDFFGNKMKFFVVIR